ncbi:hypothetical protein H696_02469 [Fonticula alba]|uniref:Uncharacterized protein n=1 Tax=Fonticula alba TaxID=691883 RepID=A0A058ZAW1_FONAL|nr:hypothetical protein, variant 1 [Fonticula alba]XP_009494656.1 hypothetical protein, variant 2 [Fonticula alba]XP_009494657.1 hypothetical protein H696_02469 [Fonticula alba]KCV71532.1 hypothetical protein H696_02469 [Fonticula alba]KCV71533.1 hypothetical protein, variant 1 [Fonticula alba]KCV71534.1 hypothetical protein, variant 2 [Fonticula alba]|eukprot:XP_009494655.1 hypothetical protein, variant 1 [Fonticula alba]
MVFGHEIPVEIQHLILSHLSAIEVQALAEDTLSPLASIIFSIDFLRFYWSRRVRFPLPYIPTNPDPGSSAALATSRALLQYIAVHDHTAVLWRYGSPAQASLHFRRRHSSGVIQRQVIPPRAPVGPGAVSPPVVWAFGPKILQSASSRHLRSIALSTVAPELSVALHSGVQAKSSPIAPAATQTVPEVPGSAAAVVPPATGTATTTASTCQPIRAFGISIEHGPGQSSLLVTLDDLTPLQLTFPDGAMAIHVCPHTLSVLAIHRERMEFIASLGSVISRHLQHGPTRFPSRVRLRNSIDSQRFPSFRPSVPIDQVGFHPSRPGAFTFFNASGSVVFASEFPSDRPTAVRPPARAWTRLATAPILHMFLLGDGLDTFSPRVLNEALVYELYPGCDASFSKASRAQPLETLYHPCRLLGAQHLPDSRLQGVHFLLFQRGDPEPATTDAHASSGTNIHKQSLDEVCSWIDVMDNQTCKLVARLVLPARCVISGPVTMANLFQSTEDLFTADQMTPAQNQLAPLLVGDTTGNVHLWDLASVLQQNSGSSTLPIPAPPRLSHRPAQTFWSHSENSSFPVRLISCEGPFMLVQLDTGAVFIHSLFNTSRWIRHFSFRSIVERLLGMKNGPGNMVPGSVRVCLTPGGQGLFVSTGNRMAAVRMIQPQDTRTVKSKTATGVPAAATTTTTTEPSAVSSEPSLERLRRAAAHHSAMLLNQDIRNDLESLSEERFHGNVAAQRMQGRFLIEGLTPDEALQYALMLSMEETEQRPPKQGKPSGQNAHSESYYSEDFDELSTSEDQPDDITGEGSRTAVTPSEAPGAAQAAEQRSTLLVLQSISPQHAAILRDLSPTVRDGVYILIRYLGLLPSNIDQHLLRDLVIRAEHHQSDTFLLGLSLGLLPSSSSSGDSCSSGTIGGAGEAQTSAPGLSSASMLALASTSGEEVALAGGSPSQPERPVFRPEDGWLEARDGSDSDSELQQAIRESLALHEAEQARARDAQTREMLASTQEFPSLQEGTGSGGPSAAVAARASAWSAIAKRAGPTRRP